MLLVAKTTTKHVFLSSRKNAILNQGLFIVITSLKKWDKKQVP